MSNLYHTFSSHHCQNSRLILSHQMILMGFINSIVRDVTRVPDSKVAAQRNHLEELNVIQPINKRGLRKPYSIIRPKDDYRHASNIMLMYMRICQVNPFKEVNVPAVWEAHRNCLMAFLEINPGALETDFISINDIYSLAMSIKKEECHLQRCPDCSSISLIVISRGNHDKCAFCRTRNISYGKRIVS